MTHPFEYENITKNNYLAFLKKISTNALYQMTSALVGVMKKTHYARQNALTMMVATSVNVRMVIISWEKEYA